MTLGDVLYAKPKSLINEREWVELVRSIADGDENALHGLFDRAQHLAFTLALRLTANRETAEEITIDVFFDIWRGASRYDPERGTVIAWIMNQARSRSIDRLRFDQRKKRKPTADGDPGDSPAADPVDLLRFREQQDALHAAMADLTADERRAIELTFFGGLTYAEAATKLGQPLGTIKTRIRSGLIKLRKALAEAD